jgi:hypothetical protein
MSIRFFAQFTQQLTGHTKFCLVAIPFIRKLDQKMIIENIDLGENIVDDK